jgi:hypothetical protein
MRPAQEQALVHKQLERVNDRLAAPGLAAAARLALLRQQGALVDRREELDLKARRAARD